MYRHICKTSLPALTGAAFLTVAAVQAAERVELEKDGLTHIAHLEMASGKSLEDGVILMLHGTMAHGRMGQPDTRIEDIGFLYCNVPVPTGCPEWSA